MYKRQAVASATALALAALTLTACSDAADGSHSSADPTAAMGHIHGLGLVGERLYVATHQGVYTPTAKGEPELVGDSRDDFMGFTVADDTTFYASGHPADGGNKGLIRSTDAGKTWTSLSLDGQSDFHALEFAHGTIYGIDATNGRLRTSTDGMSWKDGATLQALDIAVSPEDPGIVLATTAEGIARSADGGKNFTRGKEPMMAFLSWPAKDALYGVDTSGGLRRSGDGGATWKQVSTLPGGGPQALTALDAEHVLAATQDGVYESRDGGRTFARRLAVETSGGH